MSISRKILYFTNTNLAKLAVTLSVLVININIFIMYFIFLLQDYFTTVAKKHRVKGIYQILDTKTDKSLLTI